MILTMIWDRKPDTRTIKSARSINPNMEWVALRKGKKKGKIWKDTNQSMSLKHEQNKTKKTSTNQSINHLFS